MKKRFNSHDRLFKQSMRHQAIARDWFRSHVPKEIWSQVDLNSFCLMDKEFTVAHDRELRSDILYRVKLIDSEQYIYLLVEHQSTPDRFMSLRIAEYILAIINLYYEEGSKHVPLVLAFCIYHGTVSPYPFSTNSIDCFPERYRELASRMLFPEFCLDDLTTRSSESIKEDGLASFFQHLLKCNREPDHLEFLERAQLVPCVEAIDVAFTGAKAYLRACARYIINELGEGKPGELDKKLAILSTVFSTTLRGNIMTLARQLRQRGREEGIQEGVQKGKLEGIQEGVQKGKLEGIQEGIQKGLLKGKEEGLQKGLQEGEKKTLEHVVQAMVANGLSIEQIATMTQLPVEKLQQIFIQ